MVVVVRIMVVVMVAVVVFGTVGVLTRLMVVVVLAVGTKMVITGRKYSTGSTSSDDTAPEGIMTAVMMFPYILNSPIGLACLVLTRLV